MGPETPMRIRLRSLTEQLQREFFKHAGTRADHAVLHAEFDALKARYRALAIKLMDQAVDAGVERATAEQMPPRPLGSERPANPDELKRLTDENADLQRKLAAAERSSLLHSDSQRQAMAKVRDLERDLSNARADNVRLAASLAGTIKLPETGTKTCTAFIEGSTGFAADGRSPLKCGLIEGHAGAHGTKPTD